MIEVGTEKRWTDFSGVRMQVYPTQYWFTSQTEPSMSEVFLTSNEVGEKTTIFSADGNKTRLPEDAVGPYSLFEFRIPNPFNMPGFIAGLTEQIAALGKPVLVFSGYSRDYLFIRTVDETLVEERIKKWMLTGK